MKSLLIGIRYSYLNKKHKTKHNEYVCYKCGFTADRDYNAVMNLLALVN